jgi:tetratricopeptide (TPR) repeat protein
VDLSCDVWCSADDEIQVLKRELAHAGQEDSSQSAVLLYELGRVHLALDNRPAAAQLLLRSYTLRPQFRPTIRLARHISRERQDYRLVLKLLDAEAQATRDPLERSALRRAQAQFHWHRLADLNAARESLEQALRLDATSLATLFSLDLLSRVGGDEKLRVDIIMQQLDVIVDTELRAALYYDLALLQRHNDVEQAARTLASAHELVPNDLALLALRDQVHQAIGNHEQRIDDLLLAASLPDTPPSWSAKLHARAGLIAKGKLQDPDHAAALLSRSLEQDVNLATAHELFELLVQLSDWKDAVNIGGLMLEQTSDPRFRSNYAFRLGEICRRRLSDVVSAANWYRKCLAADPSYQPAVESLSAILGKERQSDALLAVHRAEIALDDSLQQQAPHVRAHRLYRIGQLLVERGDVDEGIEAFREALTSSPSFEPAAAALERIYRRHERWNDLLQLFSEQLDGSGASDSMATNDLERQAYLLSEMAEIWQHRLGRTDDAIGCYLKLLRITPNNLPVLRTAARLCSTARRWKDLVELTDEEVTLTSDPQRKAELLQRSGEVWEGRLLQLDQAIACYQQALEFNPEYLPALRSLGRVYRQRGSWRKLIEMYRTEASITTDTNHAVDLLSQIAEIYEEELLDLDGAAETCQVILSRRPSYLPAIEALARIYEARGRWRELVDLFESNLDTLADASSQAARLLRIAQLRASRLGDRRGAIADLERALRLDPEQAGALSLLLGLLEQEGDVTTRIDLLGTHLQRVGPEYAGELAAHISSLVDHELGDTRRAVSLLERACESDSPSIWHLWSLARIQRRLQQYSDLANTLERIATATSDERAQSELHLQTGLLRQILAVGDPLVHLTRGMSLRSGNTLARIACEWQLREHSSWEELPPYLDARAETTRDPLELAAIFTEQAEIKCRQGDRAGAEDAYRKSLEQVRGHLPAIWGLAALLEADGRWQELAELSEIEASAMESTHELASALFRAGRLWAESVNQPDRAVSLLQRALKVLPGHLDAFSLLRRIHLEAGQHHELATLIRSQISATSDQLTQAQLFAELGKIYLTDLGQQRKGEACLRRAVELNQNDQPSFLLLAKAYKQRAVFDRAERCYLRAEHLTNDPAVACEIQRELADVYLALDKPDLATLAYERALASCGRSDLTMLRAMVSAAALANNAGAQVLALDLLSRATRDEAERIDTRLSLASVAEEQLADDEKSMRALQEILALDPLRIEAIERLAALYGRLGSRNAASQHLQASLSHHRAALARGPRHTRLYSNMARIYRWQRSTDALFCCYVALERLGSSANDSAAGYKKSYLDSYEQRCKRLPQTPLAEARYQRLILPRVLHGPLMQKLEHLLPIIRKQLARKPSELGLSRGRRLSTKHAHHATLAAQLSLLPFELPEFWIDTNNPQCVVPVLFSKPSLVVGEQLISALETANTLAAARARFALGQASFWLHAGALVAFGQTATQLQAMLAALSLIAHGLKAAPEGSDAKLLEAFELYNKRLGRKEKKGLAELFDDFDQAPPLSTVTSFANALRSAAHRVALYLSGSPRIALGEIDDQSGVEELLQFVVSDEHFTLRIEAGIAPGSG